MLNEIIVACVIAAIVAAAIYLCHEVINLRRELAEAQLTLLDCRRQSAFKTLKIIRFEILSTKKERDNAALRHRIEEWKRKTRGVIVKKNADIKESKAQWNRYEDFADVVVSQLAQKRKELEAKKKEITDLNKRITDLECRLTVHRSMNAGHTDKVTEAQYIADSLQEENCELRAENTILKEFNTYIDRENTDLKETIKVMQNAQAIQIEVEDSLLRTIVTNNETIGVLREMNGTLRGIEVKSTMFYGDEDMADAFSDEDCVL